MSIRVGDKLIDVSSLCLVTPDHWTRVDVEPCYVKIRSHGTTLKGRLGVFYKRFFEPHFRTDIYYDVEQKIIALIPTEEGNYSVKSGEISLTKIKHIMDLLPNHYFSRWIEERKMLVIDLEAPLL